MPNVNVRLLPRLQPSNLGYQGLDIGLRQISGNSIFDIKPSRKRGRPFIKWDDKLSNIAEQYFLLLQVAYRADEMPSWQDAGQYFVSHFVIFCGPFIFRTVFPPCSDGIAIVVFHFVPGGRKAKKELEVEDLLPVGFAYLMSLRKMRCSDANPKKNLTLAEQS